MSRSEVLRRVWRDSGGDVRESVHLHREDRSIIADGVILQADWRIRYRIRMDGRWRTRQVRIDPLELGEEALILNTNGVGTWLMGPRSVREELQGCLDADPGFSVFALAVPIRRLDLGINQSAEVSTARFSPEESIWKQVTKRILRAGESLYRVEDDETEQVLEFEVDSEGFPVSCPGQFELMASSRKPVVKAEGDVASRPVVKPKPPAPPPEEEATSRLPAITDDFVLFVQDQLEEMGRLEVVPMFGGHGIYHEEAFFAIIHGGRLFLKVDEDSLTPFLEMGSEPFRPNERQTLKSYYEVPADVLEDAGELVAWCLRAVEVARKPKG